MSTKRSSITHPPLQEPPATSSTLPNGSVDTVSVPAARPGTSLTGGSVYGCNIDAMRTAPQQLGGSGVLSGASSNRSGQTRVHDCTAISGRADGTNEAALCRHAEVLTPRRYLFGLCRSPAECLECRPYQDATVVRNTSQLKSEAAADEAAQSSSSIARQPGHSRRGRVRTALSRRGRRAEREFQNFCMQLGQTPRDQ